MPTPQKYQAAAGVRWRIQYTGPDRKRHTKGGFKTKKQADHWAAENLLERSAGTWVDPEKGKATIGALGARWLRMQTHLKPSTLNLTEGQWNAHVKPRWGDTPVREITTPGVQAWVSVEVDSGPSTVLGAHAILAKILDLAVDERRLATNPARGVKLPKKGKGVNVYLTAEQLHALVDECGEKGDLIFLLGTVGLRWGEAAALRVKDVDFDRRRISITRNAVTVRQDVIIGTPKTGELRSVSVPSEVLAKLKGRAKGKRPDELLWHRADGRPLLKLTGSSFFHGAVKRRMAADPDFPRLSPHGLRHVAAGLMVSSGANVKVVQRQMGHSSAVETLNRYADLFDGDLDAVADRMDEILGSASNVREMKKEATPDDSESGL